VHHSLPPPTCEVQRPSICQPGRALCYELLAAVHVGGVELGQGDVTARHRLPQHLQPAGARAHVDMDQPRLCGHDTTECAGLEKKCVCVGGGGEGEGMLTRSSSLI
jgi:hypothetical protein